MVRPTGIYTGRVSGAMDAGAFERASAEERAIQEAIREALYERIDLLGAIDRLRRSDLDHIARAGVEAARRLRREGGYEFREVSP